NEPGGPAPRAVVAKEAESREVEFLYRLGLLEGWLMVGHELLQSGHPMRFGHEAQKLYMSVDDELEARHFPAFDGQLEEFARAAAKDPQGAETEARYQAVMTEMEKARQLVDPSVRKSPSVVLGISARLVDAAASQYGRSLVRGRIENLNNYYASHGYIDFALRQIEAADGEGGLTGEELGRLNATLLKAKRVVGSLTPDRSPQISVTSYRALSEDIRTIHHAL
ncbi:MAG TPA: hypothetical protein VL974_01690, partial [Magnetospirillum sp.]|nr:hypothetical protein [Magnetospirillum sp.]